MRMEMRDRAPSTLYLIVILLLPLFASAPLMAAKDRAAYEEILKAEMAEFKTGKFEVDPANPWMVKSEEGTGAIGVSEFEETLKSKARGTYIFYTRLQEDQKKQVYEEFVKTGDLGAARKTVFAMMRKR